MRGTTWNTCRCSEVCAGHHLLQSHRAHLGVRRPPPPRSSSPPPAGARPTPVTAGPGWSHAAARRGRWPGRWRPPAWRTGWRPGLCAMPRARVTPVGMNQGVGSVRGVRIAGAARCRLPLGTPTDQNLWPRDPERHPIPERMSAEGSLDGGRSVPAIHLIASLPSFLPHPLSCMPAHARSACRPPINHAKHDSPYPLCPPRTACSRNMSGSCSGVHSSSMLSTSS